MKINSASPSYPSPSWRGKIQWSFRLTVYLIIMGNGGWHSMKGRKFTFFDDKSQSN